MPRTFEDYFETKAPLIGGMAAAGDELLVRRSGTVFNWTVNINRAFAEMQDNAVLAGTTVLNAWNTIGTLADVVATASLTFGTDQYTYTGPNQIYPAKVTVSGCLLGSVDTDDYEVGIFVAGLLLTKIRMTANSAEHRPFSVSGEAILATGNTIDAQIRNITATNDVTVVDAQLVIDQAL